MRTLLFITTIAITSVSYAQTTMNPGGQVEPNAMPKLKAVGANTPEKVHAIEGMSPSTSWYVESNHPTTKKALKLNNSWRYKDTEVQLDDTSGVLTYKYGAAEHLVVCAPLRFCTITLQPGERVLKPLLGDTSRWDMELTVSGQHNLTTHVLLRPHRAGLQTSLAISTDRRLYTIRLLSDEQQYMTKVSFTYDNNPEDFNSVMSQYNDLYAAKSQTPAQPVKAQQTVKSSDYKLDAENLYFDYRVKGDREIKPKRVYDDGIKTYIEFDPKIQELPTFMVKTGWNKRKIVNIRNSNGYTYVIDALFEEGELIAGVGWRKKSVSIKRNDPHVTR